MLEVSVGAAAPGDGGRRMSRAAISRKGIMTASVFIRTLAGTIGLWSCIMACSTAAPTGSPQLVPGSFVFTYDGKAYPSARAACAAYLTSLASRAKAKQVVEIDDYDEFRCVIDAAIAYSLKCPPHSTAKHPADVPHPGSERCVCDGSLIARYGTTCAP